MTTGIDVPQRMEELESLLFGMFDAIKRPTVISNVEATRIYLHVSWVHVSGADSSLDSRRVLTVILSHEQLERYSGMNATARDVFREQLKVEAQGHFNRQRAGQTGGRCTVDYEVPDDLSAH